MRYPVKCARYTEAAKEISYMFISYNFSKSHLNVTVNNIEYE